jgi:hypothetical protein
MRLPLLLVIASSVGIGAYALLGTIVPRPTASPSPSATPIVQATFDTDFAAWGLEVTLPASWVPSVEGDTTYNSWTPIASDLVLEKVYYDEGLDYIFPSNFCRTDQQIAEADRIAAKYGGAPTPAADQWLACAILEASAPDSEMSGEVALAIYAAGGTRLSVDGRAVPATCAPISSGMTIETTIYGEDGEGGVISRTLDVPLSPFETTLFGLPAYGYSVRLQTDLFESTRFIEVCAQQGDRILVLMTHAAVDVEEPSDDEGNELPLPFEELRTAYGPTPVWAELSDARPALVSR